VGEWGEEKYQLVRCYAEIFATGMKNLWERRVYIDLYAGSGRARLENSNRIVEASPLQVLSIKDPFDRYIFCDLNEDNVATLKSRVHRDHAGRDVEYVRGDSNETVDKVIGHIPQHRMGFRVLSFCFVDPFKIANLKFATIKKLADKRAIDFLVLIPTGMDATRNQHQQNRLLQDFLGNASWRDDRAVQPNRQFSNFFIEEFAKSMQSIGYRWDGLSSTRVIRNLNNSPIYHLAFFSKNPRGSDFWKKCQQSTTVQRSLF
jgi:three-Cys-motif partner protein